MEITKKMIENVQYMAEHGDCEGIDCIDCPFFFGYNNGVKCTEKGFTTSVYTPNEPDELQKESAKKWLLENQLEGEK